MKLPLSLPRSDRRSLLTTARHVGSAPGAIGGCAPGAPNNIFLCLLSPFYPLPPDPQQQGVDNLPDLPPAASVFPNLHKAKHEGTNNKWREAGRATQLPIAAKTT